MEHTQKRQTEVDRVCKAYQVKSQSQGRETTPRKVSAKSATKGTPGYVVVNNLMWQFYNFSCLCVKYVIIVF
ncbi:hypothetical protein O3G_MSEX001033 [Manduca sexta]|nr:hypothetical protein O3G_MSEX001033 [Manduca sexta]